MNEEESTFFPHYEIHIDIQEPLTKHTPRAPGFSGSPQARRYWRVHGKRPNAVPLATIKEWCEENLGPKYYHLGVDKVVVYNEVDVMAVKLRWL